MTVEPCYGGCKPSLYIQDIWLNGTGDRDVSLQATGSRLHHHTVVCIISASRYHWKPSWARLWDLGTWGLPLTSLAFAINHASGMSLSDQDLIVYVYHMIMLHCLCFWSGNYSMCYIKGHDHGIHAKRLESTKCHLLDAILIYLYQYLTT